MFLFKVEMYERKLEEVTDIAKRCEELQKQTQEQEKLRVRTLNLVQPKCCALFFAGIDRLLFFSQKCVNNICTAYFTASCSARF